VGKIAEKAVCVRVYIFDNMALYFECRIAFGDFAHWERYKGVYTGLVRLVRMSRKVWKVWILSGN